MAVNAGTKTVPVTERDDRPCVTVPVGSVVDPSATRPHQYQGTRPPPTVTTADLQRLVRHIGTHAPVPQHFATRKWYAPFLAFDSWGPQIRRYVRRRKSGYYIYKNSTKWRCLAPKPHASGETGVCGMVFHTGGVACDRDGIMKPGELVNFDIVPAGKEWPDEDVTAIADHFRTYHSLTFRPVGRWTTPLLSFCEHPRAAVSCLCYYADIRTVCSCEHPDVGYSFCESIYRPFGASNGVIAPSAPGNKIQCVPCSPFSWFVWNLMLAIVWPLMLIADFVTLCGFPCASKKLAPQFGLPCYYNRKGMVEALGVPESDAATRCTVIWCGPCSEVQVWRELHYSGIWPGLACCEADSADRARMAPDAVWRRYGVSTDGQPVGVHPTGSRNQEEAAAMASMLSRLPPPVVAMA